MDAPARPFEHEDESANTRIRSGYDARRCCAGASIADENCETGAGGERGRRAARRPDLSGRADAEISHTSFHNGV